MDYTSLLIKTYEVSRLSHELGTMLLSVKAEKGCVYVPPGFSNKITEFAKALDALLEAKTIMQEEDAHASK